MPQEKPVLKEIFFLVHPFFELAIRVKLDATSLTRTQREFASAYLSKWGSLVRTIESRPNSVLITDNSLIVFECRPLKAMLNRFFAFAARRLKKRFFVNLEVKAGWRYDSIVDYLSEGFTPAKEISLHAFGEWEGKCPNSVGKFVSALAEKKFGAVSPVKIKVETLSELSVPMRSLPANLFALRMRQRDVRKKLRREQKKRSMR